MQRPLWIFGVIAYLCMASAGCASAPDPRAPESLPVQWYASDYSREHRISRLKQRPAKIYLGKFKQQGKYHAGKGHLLAWLPGIPYGKRAIDYPGEGFAEPADPYATTSTIFKREWGKAIDASGIFKRCDSEDDADIIVNARVVDARNYYGIISYGLSIAVGVPALLGLPTNVISAGFDCEVELCSARDGRVLFRKAYWHETDKYIGNILYYYSRNGKPLDTYAFSLCLKETIVAVLLDMDKSLPPAGDRYWDSIRRKPAPKPEAPPQPSTLARKLEDLKRPRARGPVIEKDKFYALVVGIGTYASEKIPKLQYAGRDAKSLRDFLVSEEGAGIPEKNVTLLCDEEATRTNIVEEVGKLRGALEDEQLLVFFAGHGAPEIAENEASAKYLIAYDTDPDKILSTGVGLDDIEAILDKARSPNQIVILDACFSGEWTGVRNTSIRYRPIQKMAGKKGRVVLCSCSGGQLSKESNQLKHGIFSYYLLEGLRGKADRNKDGSITVQEAFQYLERPVKRQAAREGVTQDPVLKGESGAGLVLTRVNDGS